jgi:hypothetical protein
MDKGAKDELAGSPGNGRRIGCPKTFSLKNWKG